MCCRQSSGEWGLLREGSVWSVPPQSSPGSACGDVQEELREGATEVMPGVAGCPSGHWRGFCSRSLWCGGIFNQFDFMESQNSSGWKGP